MFDKPLVTALMIRRAIHGATFRISALALIFSTGSAAWALRYPDSKGVIFPWLFAIVLVIAAAMQHDGFAIRQPWFTREKLRKSCLEIGSVAALTLLGFGLRLYRLSDLLPPFHGDEGEMGVWARTVLEGPHWVPYFGTGWMDHPLLFHYLQAGSLALFGDDGAGLRMLSVVFGSLCIPLVYAIGRTGWGPVAGYAAAASMAVSHLSIQYSRIALNNIESVWAMCLAMLLLVRMSSTEKESFVRRWPMTQHASLGLVLGLSQYLYYGSRLAIILAGALLLILWRQGRSSLRCIAMTIAAGLVAVMPQLWCYARFPAALLNRSLGVWAFSDGNVAHALGPGASLPHDFGRLVLFQLSQTLGFFVSRGDASGFYTSSIPAFDAVTIVFFWFGLLCVLGRLRRFQEIVLFAWFGLGVLFAGILTIDQPNGPRLIMMVPAVFLIAGAGVHFLYEKGLRVLPRQLLWGVAAAAWISILVTNLHLYFVDYANQSHGMLPARIADEFRASPGYRNYLMGEPALRSNHGTLRFLAPAAHLIDATLPEEVSALPDEGLLLIVLPHRIAQLISVQSRFPGGETSQVSDRDGNMLYVVYRRLPQKQ